MEGRTIFSILDYVVSNFMLPFNAMLIALLAGWAINAPRMRSDIGITSDVSWLVWCTSVRYLAPVAVFSVFLFNLMA